MTREEIISLLVEYKKELYGETDVSINLLKELDDISLEKDFMREAFYLLKVRASKEFTDIMKYNYKNDYTKLMKNISKISAKANMLKKIFELRIEDLPSSLELAILLTEHNILNKLLKEYESNHININIANFSYALTLLAKSIEKNNSRYYADIAIKPHSNMDKPIFLSVNGNYENIRDIAINKIKETLTADLGESFECCINFYFKHLIEDRTVFTKTETFQLHIIDNKVVFHNTTN